MYGAIVIDPAAPDPVAYDREHVIMLADWSFMHPHTQLRKMKAQPGYFNMQKQTLSRADGLGWPYLPLLNVFDATQLATAAIIPWVFFGTGNENILWGFQFTLGTSLLLGLLHVLAADHDGPVGRRDLLGLGAGLLAIMSSGIGLVMVLAASGTALGRRGWRAALVHAGPLAVIYLCWWIVAIIFGSICR